MTTKTISRVINESKNATLGISDCKPSVWNQSDPNYTVNPFLGHYRNESEVFWTEDIDSLKRALCQLPMKTRNINSLVIEQIKTLVLRDMGINYIDSGLLKYRNLTVLVLTGNQISEALNLPPTLIELHLNGNKFKMIPDLKDLVCLQHLGLAYNQLEHIGEFIQLPSTLISLDLSFNRLSDFDEILELIQKLQNLRILVLVGNPIFILQSYQSELTKSAPNLNFIDDLPVVLGTAEGIRQICLELVVKEAVNVPAPIESFPLNYEQPPEEFEVSIQIGLDSDYVETQRYTHGPSIKFDFKHQFTWPISLFSRLESGIEITLIVHRYHFERTESQDKKKKTKDSWNRMFVSSYVAASDKLSIKPLFECNHYQASLEMGSALRVDLDLVNVQ